MAIRYVSGDVLATSAQVLVIPVNCQGVAGRGVALQAKQQFPKWFETYRLVCQKGDMHLGKVTSMYVPTDKGYRYFLNFPTKGDWRRPSQLASLESGLAATVGKCRRRFSDILIPPGPVQSIAFPKLGCGAGDLSWEDVRPLMESYLSQLSCEVLIYV